MLFRSMCELAYAQLDPGLHERLNSMKKLIAQLFQLVRDVATSLRPHPLAAVDSRYEYGLNDCPVLGRKK